MSKLGFLGTPQIAALCLDALSGAGHEIELVVSAPDRKRGRGGELSPTPVKALATNLGLEVTDDLGALSLVSVDLAVVVAFGRIIPAALLAEVPMVNLHFSLLPRWRGAAPVERAILAGDSETGVCLMEVEAGLDTGGVYARVVTAIGEHESADELRQRLGEIGAAMLVERLSDLPESLGDPVAQVGEVTYAAKLSADDRRLHLDCSAVEVERVVRVGHAFTSWRGERLIVHRAEADRLPTSAPPGSFVANGVATGDGVLVIEEVQAPGRRRQGFDEWLRGAKPRDGERLGDVVGPHAGSTVA